MDNEQYNIEGMVYESMLRIFNINKVNSIKNIFNLMYNLDNLPYLAIEVDLTELESKLEDTIVEYEDMGNDGIRDAIEMEVISFTLDFLQQLGVVLNQDVITLSQLSNILNSIYILYTRDTDSIVDNVKILEDIEEEDNVNIFIKLIEEYVDIRTTDLYELIEDVDDDFLYDLRKFYNIQMFLENKEVDPDVIEIIKKLLEVDVMYSKTLFFNYIFNSGYSITSFDNNRQLLYSNLETYDDNIYLIPYEIVLTLSVSEDTKDNILEAYKENIDLTQISYLSEDNIKLLSVKTLIDETLSNAFNRK